MLCLDFPERPAVVWDGVGMSYGELEGASNRVASMLLRAGVSGCVGLSIPRSVERIVGLLGILKAGCAYVPMDLAQPAQRTAEMLRGLGVEWVVGSRRFASPEFGKAVFVEDVEGESSGASGIAIEEESLCYVMFTSGSTGSPKAVGVPHRAVERLVRGGDFAEMGGTWLHLAPLAFDASTLEIWAPLRNGGTLALMKPGPYSLEDIGEAIRRHRVTSMWLTAGLFSAMVDERCADLAPLSQLLTGGDVVPVAQARRVLEEHPAIRLINGYGPTENTTFTCCHRVTLADCGGGALPIGRPIAGTSVRILSEALEECPVGVAGELCAGGDGLALGYLDSPELTASRFIEHPQFGRLYRTGDQCVMRADGVVEFLGRMDDQVKIRGFRVEPGEIESVLLDQKGVRQACVVADRRNGGVRLLAAVVGGGCDAGSLRAALQKRLPAHMVPDEIREFEALPLSPNGKVDRQAVVTCFHPSGSESRGSGDGGLVGEVRGVWSELLGRTPPDDDTGFFDSGGDSLLLVRLHARLSAMTGRNLPITELFQHTTIRAQAAHLGGVAGAGTVAARAARQREALAARRGVRV